MKASSLPWWRPYKPDPEFEHLDLDLGFNGAFSPDRTFVSLVFPRKDLERFPGYRTRDLQGVKDLLYLVGTTPEAYKANSKYADLMEDFEWGPELLQGDIDVWDARTAEDRDFEERTLRTLI